MSGFRFFHAPSAVYFRDRDLVLQLALPDDGAAVSRVELIATVSGEECAPKRHTRRMLPTDGFSLEESYSVYSAVLTAATLKKGQHLSYFFRYDGEDSRIYSAELRDLPAVPPLLITETMLCARAAASFVELHNTTEQTLDLFDFELLLYTLEKEARLPLAAAAGESLLPAGRLAAVRFRTAAMLNSLDKKAIGRDEFFSLMAEEYPHSCGDIAERDPLFFEVMLAERKGDSYVDCEDFFGLSPKFLPYRLLIVPRGGGPSEALFSVEGRQSPAERTVRYSRASLWCADPTAPERAVFLTADAEPTPGFPAEGQVLLDARDTVPPVIIPLSPEDRIYLATGKVTVRFAAIGAAPGRARIWVRAGEHYRSYPAQLNRSGVLEATLPVSELTLTDGAFCYYIEISGGLYTVQCGSPKEPLSVKTVDNIGPEILSVFPSAGEALEGMPLPRITVTFRDSSGVNVAASTICLDGYNLTSLAEWGKGVVTLTPQKALSCGRHLLEISLRDMLGNRTYQKVSFSVCDGTKLQCYRGQIHSHTIDSDGEGTPAEAYTYARDVGGVDFFSVADHSHCMVRQDYEAQQALARRLDRPDEFAAFTGVELTFRGKEGYYGHLNVYQDKLLFAAPFADLPTMYRSLSADPGAIGMFNHPGDPWGNFDEFSHHDPALDATVCLIEINGRSFDRQYTLALAKGWRVAPLSNEDNHKKRWTTASSGIGVALAPALTRANILDAFRRRRTYVSTDRSLEIYYRVNGAWLGSELKDPEKLTVEALLRTKSEKGIGSIELVSEDGIVVAHVHAGALAEFYWRVELDPDFDYYYLRVNNGSTYSVTAPVFVTGRDQLAVTELKSCYTEDESHCFAVTATVKNQGEKALQDVKIDFYLTPSDGFLLREMAPFSSLDIGKLAPGEACRISKSFPDVPQAHRVSVVVSGMLGKSRYADTAFLQLSPLAISKLMLSTSEVHSRGKTVQNPFSYMEIHNPTSRVISLAEYSLAFWDKLGKRPAEDRKLSLAGMHIAAGGTLTVWSRPDKSGLTVSDFNARYGTKLIEGDDLMVTAMPLPVEGRRIDLLRGTELLARVEFGPDCAHSVAVVADTPLYYAAYPHMTATERLLKATKGTTPAPGRLLPAQIPTMLRERPDPPPADGSGAASAGRVLTKLRRAPLVPLQLASLAINALSAFKGLFSDKK